MRLNFQGAIGVNRIDFHETLVFACLGGLPDSLALVGQIPMDGKSGEINFTALDRLNVSCLPPIRFRRGDMTGQCTSEDRKHISITHKEGIQHLKASR